jgi:hypothetical protein
MIQFQMATTNKFIVEGTNKYIPLWLIFLDSLFNIYYMSLHFLLIEVRFLTVVHSAFGSINRDYFTSNQLSIFKKRNKEFEQIF